MMKALSYLFILLVMGCTSKAQTKQEQAPQVMHATGFLQENYQVPSVSKGIQRMLFVLEKGNLYLPERAFYLELATDDAKKLAAEYIMVIPLFQQGNEHIFYGNYDKPLSFELIPVPGGKDVYYTKNIQWFNEHNKIKAIETPKEYHNTVFTNPTLKDTITWANFSMHEDLRDVAEWIKKFNSNEEVTIHHIGCAETTNGGYTFHTYEKEKLSTFAKGRLGYLSNSMEQLNAPQEDATQHQWQNWLDSLLQTGVNLNFNDPVNDHVISFSDANSSNAFYNVVLQQRCFIAYTRNRNIPIFKISRS